MTLQSTGKGEGGLNGNSTLRGAATVLARYQIRNLRRIFEEFDRDILLPILLGEIALRNMSSFEARSATPAPDAAPAGAGSDCTPAPDDPRLVAMRPCNAYSIAAATGLPRETVRRKIGRLVELGWIRKQSNGHLYLTPRAVKHFGTLLCSRDLPEFLETAERARKLLEN